MNNKQQFDGDDQSVQISKNKKKKVRFWSIVCAVAFLFMGLIEVAVMEFFTVKFTVIYLSVMGSLSVVSFIVWLISNRKTY